MSYRLLPISSLVVHRANDRHGELENETAAMAWLFNNRERHMRKLAADIVDQGGVYEPPLVIPKDGRFIVFDGNRRITCLKVLGDPRKAPNNELQQYFSDLKRKWKGRFPDKISCQVETDPDRVDEILFRRHTGSQSGMGQSTWDDRMKRNFVERTGKGGVLNIADEIERRLKNSNMLPSNGKIPRSTLNRLLSSEAFRNRLGFSVVKGRFELTYDENAVMAALKRVADDLASKRVVLGDLWDVDGKQRYLGQLEAERVLPTSAQHISKEKKPAKPTPVATLKIEPPSTKPIVQKNLIPHLDYGVAWAGRLHRQHAIWQELQYELQLERHPNAIAVLLRVLLELSVTNYIDQAKPQSIHPNDNLGARIIKVAEDMNTKGKITHKYLGELRKLQQQDRLLSTDTMNRYVHSTDFSPSPDHMKAIWGSLSNYIVNCLNA